MTRACNCPEPPGGSIICNDDQLAVCSYQDGKIVAGCYDAPAAVNGMRIASERNRALSNWALQVITGKDRSLDQPITSSELSILNSGQYVNERGEQTTFVLPAKMSVSGRGGAVASAGAD